MSDDAAAEANGGSTPDGGTTPTPPDNNPTTDGCEVSEEERLEAEKNGAVLGCVGDDRRMMLVEIRNRKEELRMKKKALIQRKK